MLGEGRRQGRQPWTRLPSLAPRPALMLCSFGGHRTSARKSVTGPADPGLALFSIFFSGCVCGDCIHEHLPSSCSFVFCLFDLTPGVNVSCAVVHSTGTTAQLW